MRGKKAKLLRHVAMDLTNNLPTCYEKVVHKPKEFFTGKLDEHGVRIMQRYTPTTTILGKCSRRTYQAMK